MEKHKIIVIIIGVLLCLILVIGITYAWYTWESSNNTNITFNVGGVEVTFDTGSDITSSKLRPVSNKETGIEKGYAIEKTITINSSITTYLNLNLTLENLPDGLKHESFKWEIYKNDILVNNGNFKNHNQGEKIIILSNQKITSVTSIYKMYIWIDGENYVNPEAMQNQTFKFVLNADVTDQSPALVTLKKLGLVTNEGIPDFNQTSLTNEGVYATEDDLGTSYYFRGAVENNYVKFAGYYWRIIRINGDGTIRIIYDGTSAHLNGESSTDRQISTTKFNNNYNDNAYVGYMYGILGDTTYEDTHDNINDSTIKKINDDWYKTNIVDRGYSIYVTDAIYCNDRSISSGTGTGNLNTYYQAYNRLFTNKNPSLKCTQNRDEFTISGSLGNGNLTYSVGLITADEVVYAGGKSNVSNSSYYLYTGNYYWTISPYGLNNGLARICIVFPSGYINYGRSSFTYGVRPVISLKSNFDFIGNGTINNPFEII